MGSNPFLERWWVFAGHLSFGVIIYAAVWDIGMSRYREILLEHSFELLFASTMLLLLAFPFLEDSLKLRLIRGALMTLLFLPAIYAHLRSRVFLASTFCLLLLSLVTLWWQVKTLSLAATLSHSLAAACYFFFLALVLIRFTMRQETVSRNLVFAAVVVYILLAIAWAFLYSAVETLYPGSFLNGDKTAVHPSASVTFLYFSIVTITTVGYGDIIAASQLGRMLAMSEAFVGQIYLVVTVATVVGLRATAIIESRQARKQR